MQADEFAPFRRAVIDPRYRPALIKKGWYFPTAITNIAQHPIAGFHFLLHDITATASETKRGTMPITKFSS
jgi:hypothetical protein